jgi:putative radical SAM enzyme (TIGR03279 family)
LKRKNCGPALVEAVEEGSPAAIAGIRPGDSIITVRGEPLRDVIDLYIALAETGHASVGIERSGELDEVTLDLGGGPPGIEVAEQVFGELMRCQNNCVFCFVDSLPEGLRKPLYVKDDDYRLSFLSGNFITLTNLSRADVRRIVSERLSPLYVSLHATEPGLRKKMFGNHEAARATKVLKELLREGIELHAQVVLVRGVNDREHLDRTLSDLRDEFAAVKSIGIVPVGISTGGRRTLDAKYGYDAASAGEVLDQVGAWRERFGHSKPCAADELFFLAGLEPPDAGYYDGFPQLENGIGLARLFRDEFLSRQEGAFARGSLEGTALVTTPTGRWALGPLGIAEAGAKLVEVPNGLFGVNVNVCGLLPGASVAEALRGVEGIDSVLLPSVALDSERRFIDGMTIEQASDRSGVRIVAVESSGASLAEELKRYSKGGAG